MKKFQFPFQRAMDWRERVAETERSELEKLHQTREQIQQSRASVRTELEDLSRSAGQHGATHAEDLHRMAAFTTHLRNLDQRLKNEEQRCGSHIAQQTQKCIQADRSHKLLSQLHDQSHKQWLYEVDREIEQSAADTWNAGRARELSRTSEEPV